MRRESSRVHLGGEGLVFREGLIGEQDEFRRGTMYTEGPGEERAGGAVSLKLGEIGRGKQDRSSAA